MVDGYVPCDRRGCEREVHASAGGEWLCGVHLQEYEGWPTEVSFAPHDAGEGGSKRPFKFRKRRYGDDEEAMTLEEWKAARAA